MFIFFISNKFHTYFILYLSTIFIFFSVLIITDLEEKLDVYKHLFNITEVIQIFLLFILTICAIISWIIVIRAIWAIYKNSESFSELKLGTRYTRQYSMSNSIIFFIIIIIILDINYFCNHYINPLGSALLIFSQVILLFFIIFNDYINFPFSQIAGYEKKEESLFDNLGNLFNSFLSSPLINLICILLFCIITSFIRYVFFKFFGVDLLNILDIIPISISTILPFFIIINVCVQYTTYCMFDLTILFNFLLRKVDMKFVIRFLIFTSLACLCKNFFFLFLDSDFINIKISDLLNPANSNASNQGASPQAQPPQPPQSTVVPAPVSINSQGTGDDTQATVVSVNPISSTESVFNSYPSNLKYAKVNSEYQLVKDFCAANNKRAFSHRFNEAYGKLAGDISSLNYTDINFLRKGFVDYNRLLSTDTKELLHGLAKDEPVGRNVPGHGLRINNLRGLSVLADSYNIKTQIERDAERDI